IWEFCELGRTKASIPEEICDRYEEALHGYILWQKRPTSLVFQMQRYAIIQRTFSLEKNKKEITPVKRTLGNSATKEEGI
ncbi:hypothetical protein ACJX0J_034443, partial [Zea mays]